MSAVVLDGKAVAAEIRERARSDAEALRARGVVPGLAVVLVGDDPASQVYVRNKDRAASEAGLAVRTLRLPATATQADLLARVAALGADASVHGILVQLPLPRGLDERAVVRAIDPAKDVDGLHPHNVAALWSGEPGLFPCTPLGCLELIRRAGLELAGASALVIGRSQLVGKPLAGLLIARSATVTVAHSKSRDLAGLVGASDLVVAAVGKPGLVRGEWIRPGAVVIDVGINRLADGRLVGDVEYEAARARAGAITPVPGGVGPMTIAMLIANTIAAAAPPGVGPGPSPGSSAGFGSDPKREARALRP